MYFNRYLQKIMRTAIKQIDLLEIDQKWIEEDVKHMGIKFRSHNADTEIFEHLLKNKNAIIKQVWKLGKAHELFNKGLLNDDGTLTKQAVEYINKQQKGEIPAGTVPGDLLVEISVFNPER